MGLALALLPDAAAWLVYDRARVLDGEIWRLVTGHAVHFSWSHAGWNLAMFAGAGVWLERCGRARFLWLIGLTALASSLWFLAFMPEMARYGGLSGVVSAMVVYLSLSEMRRGGGTRAIWAAILLLFAAKIGRELLTGAALFATPAAEPFQVAPAAHIVGAAVALLFLARWRARPDAIELCCREYYSRHGRSVSDPAARRRHQESGRKNDAPVQDLRIACRMGRRCPDRHRHGLRRAARFHQGRDSARRL